jgi:hypothetical protein
VQKSRLTAVVGLAAAATLSIAACGSSSKSSSSTPAAGASASPIATVATLTGKQTAVTVNTDTIAALTKLGIKVTPEGKATSVMLSDGGAIAFPITGGHVTVYPKTVTPYVQGELDHAGSGLTFTVGSKSLNVTDFVVDPGSSMLTATVGGGKPGTPLFALDGTNLVITTPSDGYHLDGTIVKLLPSAASALDAYFGVPDGTVPGNAVIGTAHIIATG